MPRLQQFHRQPRFPQRPIKPLRQWTRLQPDPLQVYAKRAQPGDQGHRLACHLALANNLAARVNNAYVRAVQRHIDSCIILHGSPSLMLGAASPTPFSIDTIKSRDNHQAIPERSAHLAGPLPHLASANMPDAASRIARSASSVTETMVHQDT